MLQTLVHAHPENHILLVRSGLSQFASRLPMRGFSTVTGTLNNFRRVYYDVSIRSFH